MKKLLIVLSVLLGSLSLVEAKVSKRVLTAAKKNENKKWNVLTPEQINKLKAVYGEAVFSTLITVFMLRSDFRHQMGLLSQGYFYLHLMLNAGDIFMALNRHYTYKTRKLTPQQV